MLRIDVITIFPGLFDSFLSESFVGIAQQRGLAEIAAHDLRRWTTDRHRTVDDTPYGGGPGMVMKPEPLTRAIEELAGPKGERDAQVILLTPKGQRLDQALLAEFASPEKRPRRGEGSAPAEAAEDGDERDSGRLLHPPGSAHPAPPSSSRNWRSSAATPSSESETAEVWRPTSSWGSWW